MVVRRISFFAFQLTRNGKEGGRGAIWEKIGFWFTLTGLDDGGYTHR